MPPEDRRRVLMLMVALCVVAAILFVIKPAPWITVAVMSIALLLTWAVELVAQRASRERDRRSL